MWQINNALNTSSVGPHTVVSSVLSSPPLLGRFVYYEITTKRVSCDIGANSHLVFLLL